MQFIVKLFPEITIKSKPVRKQFIRHLRDNLRTRLRPIVDSVDVQRDWEKITVVIPVALCEEQRLAVIDVLSCSPGIAYFLEVEEFPFVDLHDAYEKTLGFYAEALQHHSFVVRVKRSGKHEFNSYEAERYIGGGLNQAVESARVDLHKPDITVRVEIRDDRLFVIRQRYKGLGGYPLGCLDPVVSLMSGGFDSTVASYLTMKRGMRTHFVFFNLGGRAHELGVKEVAHYLWQKYGASSRVKFVAVPFGDVVGEILRNVDDSHMGVILKRMMMRAASKVAEQLDVQALVTGESVAQVSSQTVANLAVIDQSTDKLILRPLVTMDKTDIIQIAREIGTEPFAASMPEYCGVISVRPTTRAKLHRVEYEEQKFDFAVLDKAVADARYINIDELDLEVDAAAEEVEVFSVPVHDSIIIDIRHPDEQERRPLVVSGQSVVAVPFYELHRKFADFDQSRHYLFYCDKGVMSRLHAAHLLAEGYRNIAVYRPG